MSTPPDQMQTGVAAAVDASVAGVKGEVPEAEAAEVKKINDEYNTARKVDEKAREQYNKDRRYAQGIADVTWASDANIIGAFIDILVSFLYAKNPDVSVRPAPCAGGQPDKDMTALAETLQIVISRLWRDAKLKKTMRKMVRSSLSVGPGWMKALVYSETRRNPEVEKKLNDAQDNLAKIQSLKTLIGEDAGDTDNDAKITELQNLITGLTAQVEIIVKRGMCADFCRAEDMQVSLDVADTADYLDADWVSNDMYVTHDVLRARFPDLSEEDCKTAATYFQRQTGIPKPNNDVIGPADSVTAEGSFTKEGGPSTGNVVGGDKPVKFAKIVELWDHRDNLIKTFIDGIKRWPVAPYAPPQASTRFYPYFRLAFYETDGSRHPQSLSGRLKKLQDEYSSARSNFRLVRERSVPGTLFKAGMLSPEDVTKIQNSAQAEMVGLKPTDPNVDLSTVIIAKPIPQVNEALYETGPIKYDMEVMSGVQEAQQGAVSTGKTTTEAEIQQSGFTSRTGADRDTEEEMLTDLAQYIAELSIQSLDLAYVQKIAGKLAFWPVGMDMEDVLTLLDVEITAGTTGKPQAHADKETWATLLPLVQSTMAQVTQLEATGQPQAMALAKGYRNLLGETMKRLDDRLDIDDILPPVPPVAPALPGAAPGVAPGLPRPVGAPPVGNGTVNNPGAIPPPLTA